MLRFFFSYITNIFYQLRLSNNNKIHIGSQTVLLAKIIVKGKQNSIKIGEGCTIRNTVIQINGNNNKIVFSDHVKVYENLRILIENNNCGFFIDSHSTIGSAKIQLGEKNTEVLIGEDCMLSRDIIINTSDFHSIIDMNSNKRINPAGNVKIGNHVWVGNGVYINKGATINDNCIVAAKSVVPGKSFENNTIIGGVPAKIIKEEIYWDRKIRE